ncbi:MAG: hypothetical protein IJZ74_01375 [Clostridia bacterium]|nr:hypothetical protein [Clostridia bacterium]
MSDHNRLIARTAREDLAPAGFFQAVSSRVWLEDNGWFMVMAEFKPSGFSKCSMLNLGLHFLWAHGPEEESENVSSYDYMPFLPAVNQCYAPYTGDDTLFYRPYRPFLPGDPGGDGAAAPLPRFPYARIRLAERASDTFWDAFSHAMLCFLSGPHEDGTVSLAHSRALLQQSISTEQEAGRLREDDWRLRTERWIVEEVQPSTSSRESAHIFVPAGINRRRTALMSLPKYRCMSHDAFRCELR